MINENESSSETHEQFTAPQQETSTSPENVETFDVQKSENEKRDHERLSELRKELEQLAVPDDWSVAAQTIAACAKADQYMRKNYETAWDPELDKKNTEILRGIIDEQGWPTISRVGEKISNDAWLLAQHADHDVAFQEQCFQLMQEAGEDIDRTNLPYLEDRISVNRKRPQRYGTQWRIIDGKHVIYPIEDEAHLEERRAEARLEPFSEYSRQIKEADLRKEQE